MADFGPSATQLPGPQNAGSDPIAPVTQEISPPNWGAAISSIGATVGNLAGNYAKQQKLTSDNAFLSQQAQKVAVINQGVDQGTVSTTEADTRLRTIYNGALAARPDLYQQISGIHSAFVASTASGDVETAKASAQKQRDADIGAASSAGYDIPKNATQAQIDSIVSAHKQVIRTTADIAAQDKANAEKRAQGTYDQAIAERENKDMVVQNINQLTGSNINAFYNQIQAIRADASLSPQDKALRINQASSTYEGAINAIGAKNPELVAGAKGLFENMKKAGLDYIDPTKDAASSTAQLADILNTTKISALADPKFRAVVSVSQLMGSSFAASDLLKAQQAGPIVNALSGKFQTPVTNGQPSGYTTPIIGNPDVEAGALTFLKSSLRGINSGAYTDPVKAKVEAANGINGVLAEVGKMAASPATSAKDLKGVANFLSSDEYAGWVKTGKVDAVSQHAALTVFQKTYFPAVTDALGDRLSKELVPASEDGTQSSISMAQGLTIKNDNGVLTFVPKPGVNLTPQQVVAEQATIKNLQEVTQSLNTMVHVGSHLEGSTDYSKNWEANKYYYLPQIFPVKPGQVVGNLQWTGTGDWNDKSTWRRVGQR